jgi:hypothetical protein
MSSPITGGKIRPVEKYVNGFFQVFSGFFRRGRHNPKIFTIFPANYLHVVGL